MLLGMKRIVKKRIFTDIKFSLIIIIAVTIPFVVMSNYLLNSVSTTIYDYYQQDAKELAEGYIGNLKYSESAIEIINNLLEEKILVASRITALYPEELTNKKLNELTNIYLVDEMYVYNPEGVVIYSSSGEFIGWEASIGHPVYEFMVSEKQSYVGPIRKNTSTGVYHKYGYFRNQDGFFVQAGIKADNISMILESFTIDALLHEMTQDCKVTEVCLIDNNYTIAHSTKTEMNGTEISDERILVHLKNKQEYYESIVKDGNSCLQVFVPITFDHSNIAMRFLFSHERIDSFEKNLWLYGLIMLLLAYLLILILVIYSYKKRKQLLVKAYTDEISGLPNHSFLTEFLTTLVTEKKRVNNVLFLIHISNYEDINISHGSMICNEMINTIVEKLSSLTPPIKKRSAISPLIKSLKTPALAKSLFRHNDNTFALIIPKSSLKGGLVREVQEINSLIPQNIDIRKGTSIPLDIKIGIVEIGDMYTTTAPILQDASLALQEVDNKDNYCVFNRSLADKRQRRESIEKELNETLEGITPDKLYLVYQPQVDLKTDKVVGFEALARFKSDSLSEIPPLEFIDIAETKFIINHLGDIILEKVCQFIQRLDQQGFHTIKVAANVSSLQLLNSQFPAKLLTIIKTYNIAFTSLELEITESVFFKNFNLFEEVLKEISKHNIHLAIDDFGTGYSSLARLGITEFNVIKLDKLFIDKILFKDDNAILLTEIISMLKKLGFIIVAEGIETDKQKEFLINADCDIGQGYFLGKPMDEKRAIDLISS